MAQFNKVNQDYLNQERSLFEVNMIANKNGEVVTVDNPFPVSLGSSNITINGDVSIGATVDVSSSSENPIHNHITEVGTSDILNVPYLPVGVGTVDLGLSYLPIGISTANGNVVSISNTSFYVTGIGSTVDVNVTNDISVSGIGSTVSVEVNLNNSPVSTSNRFPVDASISGTIVTTPASQSTDAFGRLRVSNPLTLFDSSHRYRDNNLWASKATGVGATYSFDANAGLINLGVGTASGVEVVRETTKVFAYQPGKALRNGEPVLTPTGWKNIESLKVGDKVFDGNGQITEIEGVYPQGKRKIFRLTFDDGSIIDADGDHLWVTICRNSTKNYKKGDKRILTTTEMIANAGNVPSVANRWRIPCSPVLEIKYKEVRIDPYTLGVILGDGGISHSASVTFWTADEEILDYLVCDKITTRKGSLYCYGLTGLSKYIQDYKLNNKNSFNKFVPFDYKFNSKEVRLNVLRGLMDTDGWVEKDGCTYFASCCEQLADDVCFLVRSLGGTAKIKKKESCFYYNKNNVKIECAPSYRVKISIPINPFRLTRKSSKWHCKWRVSFDRYVYSIQEICEDNATCIRVTSEDHTFITRNHIVTHNSLLIMNTFVMNPAKNNLRQRVGYGGTTNGIYLELNGSTLNFVERSSVTGILSETRVPQSQWNIDTVGAGALNPSGVTLDISKAQILFTDIEWLGLGTVRVGFAINGQLIHCHSFHHANYITSTYITTASLPLRYEITNTGITTSSSTMKQVCSTVISEGGYELRGLQQAIGTPITDRKILSVAGTFYPVVSLRLKSSPNRLDAIVIMTALSMIADTASNFNWQVRASGTTSGGAWVTAGDDSAVEYNLTGTSMSGGRILASGYFTSTGNTSVSVDILKEALFKFQLERDGLTGTPYELILCAACKTNNEYVYGSVDWEEISR